MLKEYIIQNWSMILILIAFAVILRTTIFLEKKIVNRLYGLIAAIFALSILVFVEFYYTALGGYRWLRIILMSIRYSVTPFIIAFVLFALIKKYRWVVFIPAILLTIINVISIFTGIVFSVTEDYVFVRGPLGYLPFIMVGLYCAALIYVLFMRSNKKTDELVPILFLCLAFVFGIALVFIFKALYAQIFCITIAIVLFVCYVFMILERTKKDPLTGLLNRQAYYSDVSNNTYEITSIISLDMNGLKVINDRYGHIAGDEAIITLANCFRKAVGRRHEVYRVGGDEFLIVCRNTSLGDVLELIDVIKKLVADTKYSCSIGYSYSEEKEKDIDKMVKESDEMMYAKKAEYYKK